MSQRKLLLADDSVTIQKVVNLTFADEGINVVTVGDGDAAIELLAELRPDIVLADVNMPGLNGYQVCEVLRANDETREVPVILLVGSFEPFDESEAARVGANAYLTKPFQSIKQLIAQVNELLESSSAQEPPTAIDEAVTGTTDEPATAAGDPATQSPAPSASQTEDIDSLYEQSMVPGSAALSDVGIDDDMIETSYTAGDQTADAVGLGEFSEPSSDSEIEVPLYETRDAFATTDLAAAPDPVPEVTPEPPYAAPQSEELPPVSVPAPAAIAEQPSEPYVPAGIPATNVTMPDWAQDDDPPAPVEQPAPEPQQTEAAPAESSPAADSEPSPFMMPIQAEELRTPASYETTRLSDIPSEQPEPVAAAEPGSEIRPAEMGVPEDTIRMDTRFDNTSSPDIDYQDVDILDLETGPIEITTPADAVARGSEKRLVTLTPELIEMIVQRVIEKMSEKY